MDCVGYGLCEFGENIIFFEEIKVSFLIEKAIFFFTNYYE